MSDKFETVYVKIKPDKIYFECNPGNIQIPINFFDTYTVEISFNSSFASETYLWFNAKNYFLYFTYPNNKKITSVINFNNILTKDIIRDMKLSKIL